jgi:hypothetical protein
MDALLRSPVQGGFPTSVGWQTPGCLMKHRLSIEEIFTTTTENIPPRSTGA